MRRARALALGAGGLALAIAVAVALARPQLPGGETYVHIAPGSSFREVVDSLANRQVIARPGLFRAYARMRRLDRSIKAGTYQLARGERYGPLLETLTNGRVETYPATFPEGLTLRGTAGRIAAFSETRDSAEIFAGLAVDTLHLVWDVPGPGLEGYLFPDTYRFAKGVGLDHFVAAMTSQYRRYWTPERRERLAETGLTEREAVTLASIVQAESRHEAEMSTIASVYHNRLRAGMRLQADPTVLYALGGHRSRLLYAAIDSVADHPYNTYAHAGLPPGPIGAPGRAALDAVLDPAATDYYYFVARPNGEHVFTRSLRDHNNARIRIRREAAQRE